MLNMKISNLNQIRLFSKNLDYVNFEYLWMSNFMQKIRKNEWIESSGTAWTQIFWRNVKCFKIKIPNLNQIRLFLKKIDYVNFEYLWMSNFMQKIRKNEWTILQVLHERRFFDGNVKCFKIKIPNLNQIRLFSKKLIMSILSIYECLTSCKKSEKTNERFLRYCMNADFLM